MRVILSRKGFDSSSGGNASPIIDNKLISLPIPEDNSIPCQNSITYNNLKFEDTTYFELMKSLLYSNRKKKPILKTEFNGVEKQLELTKEIKCHLDPDIRKGVIEQHKHNEWKPLFGQVGTAQSYLINQAVKKNDIFLFYGRFKKTEGKDNRNLKFVPEDEFPTDRHIIYGYLQVGKKITLNKNKKLSDVPKWMHYHPHLCLNKYKKYKNKQTNTVYIASDTLRAGTFDYDGSLVLTKKSHTISHWDLQKLFQGYLSKDEVKLLRLTKESNDIWKKDEFGENYYVSNRFQERVINIEKEVNIQKKKHILYQVEKWAKDLIKNYAEM